MSLKMELERLRKQLMEGKRLCKAIDEISAKILNNECDYKEATLEQAIEEYNMPEYKFMEKVEARLKEVETRFNSR